MAYDPERPEDPATRRIIEVAREDGGITPLKWGGLRLPGAGGRATFMLALAAQTGPDIYKAWFHILRHDVEHGFVYPLDEWMEGRLPPRPVDLWDAVRRKDGHVWALPAPAASYYGIIYRKDFVAQAGMDPEKPPETWSGFRDWCVRLAKDGRKAFAIENRPWGFLPWVQSAGGDVIREIPGKKGEYEACFGSAECIAAAEYLQSLVRLGVVRGLPVLGIEDDIGRLFSTGAIAAAFGGEDTVVRLVEVLDMPAESIGIMPFPAADSGGVRVLQAHRHFYAMGEGVARRPKAERDKVFKCLEALCSQELADAETRRSVAAGRAQWCRPSDLKRLGYEAEAASIPRGAREMYAALERGEIKAATEPWAGFWQGASDIVQRKFLGLLLSGEGPGLDCAAALREIDVEANRGLMFDADKSRIEAARPLARIVAGVLLCCIAAACFFYWRRRAAAVADAADAGPAAGRRRALAPWLFLAPAILSILVWSYWPLLRGAAMAFQDYRIVGDSRWAGLDNFIRTAMDGAFWAAWLRTFEYVAVTLLLGFATPVLLAVMLCEIPKGKVFFRFLYFLPHLTSALVVALLWKMMFDPGADGILNRFLALFGVAPQAWLQDPALAMTCCIVPGAWAGAGVSSLIYIAAIESLPKELCEAAAMDGAGVFARFRHVVFPQLAPLLLINFVGAFIAAFQGMGSIFLLTFGGPGDATQVVSLQIWKEAYNNLRFSTATTMAWFLGTALIGWTFLQIRLLRKVEFRRAAAN